MATRSDDPWGDIDVPSVGGVLNTRRVDAGGRWHFFWARAFDGKCLLVLRHRAEMSPAGSLPSVQGITVSVSAGEPDDGALMLMLALEDGAQRDIFVHLCRDIIRAAEGAESEEEAVARTVARTWRWHHLLRGGRRGLLTEEEQRGLIGELLVLEKRLLPNLASLDAVGAWRGPLGAPKDFEIDRISVEVKARRGAARPYVTISSEYQLDDEGCDQLFLQVLEVDRAAGGSTAGDSLSDVVSRVHAKVGLMDPGAVEHLDALLAAAGFRWDDDYSESSWIVGAGRIYLVSDSFPRLTTRHVPAGVSKVRYALSLPECEEMLMDEDALPSAIRWTDDDGTD